MKHTLRHTIYICSILPFLMIAGCRKQYPVADKLQQAEAMMDEHPDSALHLLESIEQPELQTRGYRVRYALLYSQALDKNYIDLTNDSLISIAVDYYKDRNDVKAKFQAYYYLGRIYTNANELTQAILAYMEAEQLVDEWGDDYAAGLLYSQMGDIYQDYYDFPKALESYRLSTEYFRKANKPLHKLWGMLSQSAVYKDMNKEPDSFHILQMTLKEAKETNQTSIVRYCLGDLILLCLDMDRQEEAVSYYNELTSNHSMDRMTSSLYANLSLLMVKEKDTEKSRLYMKEAWKRAKDLNDSINLYYLSAQVEQMAFSYQKAYSDLVNSVTLQNGKIRKSLQQPILTAQKDFLNRELELQKYKLQAEKTKQAVGIAGVLLLVGGIIYGFYIYQKHQRKKYLKQIQKQVARIELLKGEKDGMEEEVRNLNRLLQQQSASADEMMQAKGEWTCLDDIRSLELYTRLRQDLKLYNPSSDFDNLLRWVNLAHGCFAERLTEKYPHLNTSEITLCCLVRMGYSHTQIAEILHVKMASVNRYIYRTCASLELPNCKKTFAHFM